ncbi:D-galacturonic acid-responsive regulator GaaR-like protein [Penicillium ucsense]|uniref:D-galacturonic acid-responsive regulator GaaR-like protein n=1 Tax=Penicillium ucsense TaxID=2839758 RepID=A0A8J8W5S5_9EURO|nr:D-galacturonic acid-responsive regulator GaaR-like protein [Penicillium ucsense]KAF7735627.1 D-galacturonic acid-responsive regulator GaaR-like protein [Penicillium ucsense]
MSRPQVSIDRLTPRRAAIEPREAMNCKSCRKRKIKCNRLRPSCEACKVFQCPCIYDAIPKKRGPKTDVLEALLKRVDGLEKKLQDEKSSISPTSPREQRSDEGPPQAPVAVAPAATGSARRKTIDASSYTIHPAVESRPPLPSSLSHGAEAFPRVTGQSPSTGVSAQSPASQHNSLSDGVLNAFFARLHGKPFHILDEAETRQRHQANLLPTHLAMAISAMTIRYTVVGQRDQAYALRMGLETAMQARRMIDVDDPTIDGLQSLLLLSQAFFAYGMGKKAYMTFSNCAAMAVALDLLREMPSKANVSASERETRRRLFWSIYLMDRFITSGSKRPCLIADHSIVLRLPSWSPHAAGLSIEGELFHVGPNIQYSADSRRKSPSAASLLIDITRILGVTNRYLAAGGVKGDSHFPWHALSNLSKIRQELDIWAAGTQDVFSSIEALFGHPESTTLLLSKLIYHLVHCLIYRPFLPIDLVELRGTGQHQSWQIEATNLCFSHSNAIAELVELGRNAPLIEWPAFVGYCVCMAGTVHVHGVHYKGREGEVFSSSAEFLTREMHQLAWLRTAWAGVQHQRELLQSIYTCHAELVRNLASSSMRFSPVFHLEDFLDRYAGLAVDGAHVQLVDTGDELINSPSAFGDQQAQSHTYRPMAPPSSYQQQTPFYGNDLRPTPPTLPSSNTPESSRRRNGSQSQAQSYHTENLHQQPPSSSSSALSPVLHFHRTQAQQSQPSPGLSSIFHMQSTPEHLSHSNSHSNHDPTQHLAIPNAFSPSAFALSPPAFLADSSLGIAPTPPSHPQYATFPFDTNINQSGAALTPGAQSQTSGSHTASSETGNLEKDPFLSLLEQLAENEHSQGGPSELDFFLTGAMDAMHRLIEPYLASTVFF